jgi:hypothetical protein
MTCALNIKHSSTEVLVIYSVILPQKWDGHIIPSRVRSTVNGPMLSQPGSMSGTATRFTLSSRPVGPSPSSCETIGESGLVYFCAASPHCINRHSTCPSHSLVFLYRIMEQPHPLAQSSSPSVSIPPLPTLSFGPNSSLLGPKFSLHNRTYT